MTSESLDYIYWMISISYEVGAPWQCSLETVGDDALFPKHGTIRTTVSYEISYDMDIVVRTSIIWFRDNLTGLVFFSALFEET